MSFRIWNHLQKLPFEVQESDFAVLVLNQPILCNPGLVHFFWNKAVIRGLVDGGCNRWLEFLNERKNQDFKLPDFFSGDFDSIKPETKAYFNDKKIKEIVTQDQNETDFTKALRVVNDFLSEKKLKIDLIIVICENSGRLDQIMANINTLHLTPKILKDITVMIWSHACVTWLLEPGKNEISVGKDFVSEQYPCGLIPVCGPTIVSTSGFKWNLSNHTMEFGNLVSTSNTYAAEKVTIHCNKSLIFTTQYCKN